MPQKRACHFHGIPSSLAWFEYGEKEDGGGECGDQEVVTDEIEKMTMKALACNPNLVRDCIIHT